MKTRLPINNDGANTEDYSPVAICFKDDTINDLFSALLEVRGVRTSIIETVEELGDAVKLITEPQYFDTLSTDARSRCLIVGTKESLKGLEALQLVQPLTADKIENAIARLLAI